MKFSSICKYNLLLAVLLSNSAYAKNPPYYPSYSHSNSNHPTVFETVAAVGLVAAAAYGFYKLCDWLFTKTDEQVLQDAKACLREGHNCADVYIAAVKAGLGEFPESEKEQQIVLKSVSEEFLYQFAMKINSVRPISALWGLSETPYHLAQAGKAASKRAAELRKKNPHAPIIKDLEKVSDQLGALHTETVFANEFYQEHGVYFDLFALEARLLAAYVFELSSLDYNANNLAYLREAIRLAVMKKAANERVSYPYMKFEETLKGDMSSLAHHISCLKHTYANRRSAAHLLAQRLDAIYTVVVSEDAYRQELRDHKKEMLERERIAAEQAKAQAAAAQAYAAQQQAYALQQQANAMHHQNHLQQQQNQILASQGPARVNVYL